MKLLITKFTFQTTPLKDSIKIGEYLTILVYLKDVRNQFSLKIHDCWAYDNDEYDSPRTNKIQLTDQEGCPRYAVQIFLSCILRS